MNIFFYICSIFLCSAMHLQAEDTLENSHSSAEQSTSPVQESNQYDSSASADQNSDSEQPENTDSSTEKSSNALKQPNQNNNLSMQEEQQRFADNSTVSTQSFDGTISTEQDPDQDNSISQEDPQPLSDNTNTMVNSNLATEQNSVNNQQLSVASSMVDSDNTEYLFQDFSMLGYLSHIEGRGIGYERGYTTLGVFISSFSDLISSFQPFLDVRGHWFDNGTWSANFGVGFRYFDSCWEKVFGINVFYDYRRAQFRHNFQQIGVGLEMIGNGYEVTINGYIPFDRIYAKSKRNAFTYPGGYYATCRGYHEALAGVDAELEMCLFNCCPFELYGALGPYYYHQRCGDEIVGGRCGLGVWYEDYLSLEVLASYDNVYHTIVQGVITLAAPFGYSKCEQTGCCSMLNDCALLPVNRQEIIVSSRRKNFWHSNF